MKDYIKKLISERESKMYHYYKSVFTEDFEGGYPIEYDEELLKVEQNLLNKVEEYHPKHLGEAGGICVYCATKDLPSSLDKQLTE